MKEFKDKNQFSLYRSYILDPNECCPGCISSDGSKLYRGSDDNNIKVWNLKTGKLIGSMSGHNRWIESLTLSPDGAYLISSSYDDTIRIWKTIDNKCYLTIKLEEAHGQNISINKVITSHDNKIIAAAINDYDNKEYYVNLYDFKTGNKIKTFLEHRLETFAIAIHPEGYYLASGGRDKTIILYDLNNRTKIADLIGPNSIFHLNFINNGALIISGEAGGNIRIWEYKKKKLVREFKTDSITTMAISPTEKILAIASLAKHPKYSNEVDFQGWHSMQHILKIWNYETGKLLQKLPIETLFNPIEEELNHITFSSDGNTIIAGFRSHVLKIWKKSNNNNIIKYEKSYEKKCLVLRFMGCFKGAMKKGDIEEIAIYYEHSESYWNWLSKENFLELLEMNLVEFLFKALEKTDILYFGFDKHDETLIEYYIKKLPPSESEKLRAFKKIYKQVPIIYREGLKSFIPYNQYVFEIIENKVMISYIKYGPRKFKIDPFVKSLEDWI